MRWPRLRPRHRHHRLSRWLRVNTHGGRATSVTTPLGPFSIEWWRAPRRRGGGA